MGKGQYRDRDRGKRQRGFDDDVFIPQQDAFDARPSRSFSAPTRESPVAQGPVIEATVKMFNSEKGYGFVALSDGSGDAFLHIATLQAGGHEAPMPGAKLKVQAGQGPKGQQVTAVLEVDNTLASPARPKPAARPNKPDPSTAVELNGTVKWFNPEKGFGFVQVDGSGKDVFLHISVVERSGLQTLAEGTPVLIRAVEGQKGREAISVSVLS